MRIRKRPAAIWLGIYAVGLSLLAGLTAAGLLEAQDEFGKPTGQSRQVSRIVASLMQQHLSNRRLNDEISQRAFETYLKNLDPMKMYFTEADIDELSAYSKSIDEMMTDGDYTAAFAVFQRFLERLDQCVELAMELIDVEHDFTVDEHLVTDRDLIDYADDAQEIRDRWRKRIKYNLLVLKGEERDASSGADDEAAASEEPDQKEKLRKRYRSFANRMHQFDNEDVIEMYITSITTAFDPHTSYMSKTTFDNFLINMRLELEGIGATLQSTDDGMTVIRRIVPGGAADKNGELKVDDKIVAVGQGNRGDMVDVTDMKLDDVVQMIRGQAGTEVRLGVIKPNTNEIKTIQIVRERIELKDSEAHGVVFDQGEKADGTPYRIGVIDLPSFYTDMESSGAGGGNKSTTRDVRRILQDFRQQGVDAVVLDLRRNGGGSLKEAIDCTGLFIDRGPVVQVKDSYGQIQALNDEVAGASWSGPLVVVTSKFSASASEILAGAVQDYHRGLVVGDSSTHGKGTVQTLLNLGRVLYRVPNPPNTMGALKITIQQFYRPNGDSTQKRGVLADVVLPALSDHMDVGEADLDFPVEFDQVKTAQYTVGSDVPDELVQLVREKSAARVADDRDFQKEVERIERYLEQKNRKQVSLNEEQFFARRKELDAEKEDEKAIEDQVNHVNEIQRDYYMNEVLRIAVDYMNALKGGIAQK